MSEFFNLRGGVWGDIRAIMELDQRKKTREKFFEAFDMCNYNPQLPAKPAPKGPRT